MKNSKYIRNSIIWNQLISICEEQANVLLKVAFGALVREAGDISAGIFNNKGKMLAQAVTGTPGHVNTMAEAVPKFLKIIAPENLRKGDALITNDPWIGAGHIFDFVVVSPIFFKNKIIGYFASTCHVVDVGGIGWSAEGKSFFEEGILIPVSFLRKKKSINESLLKIITANSRVPNEARGDVLSLMSCNDAGINRLIDLLKEKSNEWKDISMLARTHGQAASPTKLGKEMKVFSERLKTQFNYLKKIPHSGKFGGATGNLNAHYVAFPKKNWHSFSKQYLKSLGLSRSYPTTQIEHYDNLSNQLDTIKRFNTILIDLNRDFWTYISMDYFKQVVNKKEVGSSAMPHKINPIDFENSEGNLGLANSLFKHLSEKLPISRLQRDLTDSTVLRNLGVPIAHSFIAYNNLLKGLNKLIVNEEKIKEDLDKNWLVVSEAIQTILRREGFNNPYEQLKNLTRNNKYVGEKEIKLFINSLKINNKLKDELMKIKPDNYTGKS